MSKGIILNIKNFRAIRQADIQINGISVVSGINGCGKSTMSKLLYSIIHNTISFTELVLSHTNNTLKRYSTIINQISYTLLIHSLRTNNNYQKPKYLNHYDGDFKLKDLESATPFLNAVKELCDAYCSIESELNKEDEQIEKDRLLLLLRFYLKGKSPEVQQLGVKKLLDLLIKQISEIITAADYLQIERPYSLLKDRLNDVFDDIDLSKKFILKEYGSIIAGGDIVNIPLLHSIKKVAYIDTPMIIGMASSNDQPKYWKELNSLLSTSAKRGYKRSINDVIKKEIIKGDAIYNESDIYNSFKYKREDGSEFNLLECATGIKTFAALQLLLKNRFLDDTTLMIIDEPEAHLHPQWIVEYARLIVLLHKRVGVKFFIASHSTDMVSAIRYISEKEKCLSAVSFYIAENERNDSYTFRSLGHDIEPIFESFNKSFERLDYYVEGKEKKTSR